MQTLFLFPVCPFLCPYICFNDCILSVCLLPFTLLYLGSLSLTSLLIKYKVSLWRLSAELEHFFTIWYSSSRMFKLYNWNKIIYVTIQICTINITIQKLMKSKEHYDRWKQGEDGIKSFASEKKPGIIAMVPRKIFTPPPPPEKNHL